MKGALCFLMVLLSSQVGIGEPMPRASAPVSLDGTLTEPVWHEAMRIERFFEIAPGDNAEPPVQTQAWIVFGELDLFVAFRCHDPQPDSIRAPYVARDRVLADQDFVQIDIDSQDDGTSSTLFRINPRGIQTDGVHTESNGRDDLAPDFEFESSARIDSGGWTAEIRIPLTSLRYPRAEPQSWRIKLYRLYPRHRRYQISSMPFERGSSCYLCNSHLIEQIRGLPVAGTTLLTPYVTSRTNKSGEGSSSEAGADFKWLPLPSLSVDATWNPDFSQIESDAPVLGVNDRFAIFYPEKRPFFMEGTDLLSTPMNAIHTRAVTAPEWGLRITGRPGNHALTVVTAEDAGGGSRIVPGPVYSSLALQPEAVSTILGRYRYSLGESTAGIVWTSTDSDEQSVSNRVLGPDFMWRPNSVDKLTGQFLASRTRDAGEVLDGNAYLLSWDRTQRHVAWNVTVQDIDEGFRADSGFMPQVGVTRTAGRLSYTGYPRGTFSRIQPELVAEDVVDESGSLVSRALFPRLTVEGWRATVAVAEWHQDEAGRAMNGSLHDVSFGVGMVRFLLNRKVPYLKFGVRHGDELDIESGRVGTGTVLDVLSSFQPVDHLQADLTLQTHRLVLRESTLFDARSLRTQLTWTFNQRTFVRAIADAQVVESNPDLAARTSSREGFVDASFLWGYRLNWQTVVYIGYGDRRPIGMAALSEPNREAFLKVSCALRPGQPFVRRPSYPPDSRPAARTK